MMKFPHFWVHTLNFLTSIPVDLMSPLSERLHNQVLQSLKDLHLRLSIHFNSAFFKNDNKMIPFLI